MPAGGVCLCRISVFHVGVPTGEQTGDHSEPMGAWEWAEGLKELQSPKERWG